MIGLMYPGEMGTAVGTALSKQGNRIAWASDGRSTASTERALRAGFVDLQTVARIAAECEFVISICPPHFAVAVAEEFAGYEGVYVDANAISPSRAEHIAHIITAGGGAYVDGAVIGLPPQGDQSARMYLSGEKGQLIRGLFGDHGFTATVIDERVSSASSLKMAYAAWTKVSSALLLATVGAAGALGVTDVLLREWDISQPGLQDRLRSVNQSAAKKSWRWVGEMEEVETTFTAVHVGEGFGHAAADVFSTFERDR